MHISELEYDDRLAATVVIFEALKEQMTEGGIFRDLIYDRLDFGADAYQPLYCAGGMDINNALPQPEDEETPVGT